MADHPTNFWQELKRRRVIRVIIGYLASAYVLLELASIVVEPLGLPEWTIKLILVLLVVGFVIAISLSWIYDFTSKGLVKTESAVVAEKTASGKKPGKRRPKVSDLVIAVLVVVVIILAWPKIFKPDKLEQLRSGDGIAIAVMPFQNMTGDTTWNIWQEGIQNELTTTLTNSEELKVRQPETINTLLQEEETINYASITPSVASNISQKLEANVFIYGTIKKAGEKVRVNAQLVDSETEDVFKSFEVNGPAREEMIFKIIDSLRRKVRDYIVINKLVSSEYGIYQEVFYRLSNSPEAYRYYLYGRKAFRKRDYQTARNWFQQALEADSNFVLPALYTSVSYGNQGLYEEAKKWCLRIYNKKNSMPTGMKIATEWLYANYFETPEEEIKHLKQALEIDEQSITDRYLLGICYIEIEQYEKAIHEFERLLELHEKTGIKPFWAYSYYYLGTAYHETGAFRKENKLYKSAEKDFPNDPALLYRQAVLALSRGKDKTGDEFMDHYISTLNERFFSEASKADNLGNIYWDAGLLDEAEAYYRQSLSLESDSALRMNNLAYFLIDENINISEGLQLIDKALRLEPDNYYYLDTKGWGLYKNGNYHEALEVLHKSWELKPVYDHELFSHIQEVERALANHSH
jgi:tetratricopeptide (TPR) repeat protein